MMGLLAAALLAGQAPATVAGVYETRQMEVGATIELKKDGTFRYMLDYGALVMRRYDTLFTFYRDDE